MRSGDAAHTPGEPGPDARRRLEAVVRGRVQGVGFRMHVASAAARHAVVGWVSNEPDGAVRAVGEGRPVDLETWLGDLRVGPSAARVTAVETAWSDASGEFARFEIRAGWHGGD